jgi:MFS family permease
MKLASDYFEKGMGLALSFLVGALVLGTAFPHFLRSLSYDFPWQSVIYCTSVFAIIGGSIIMILVPDGPFKKPSQGFDSSSVLIGFKNKEFRAAAFGYFGHMWELYTFWAFVPMMLDSTHLGSNNSSLYVSLLSFIVIASGALACVLGGVLSQRFGAKFIAISCLILSAICCLMSPIIFGSSNLNVVLGFLVFWGMVVVADSPLFSSLVAQHAPPDKRGTALTFVTCVGFFITILSIQLINYCQSWVNEPYIYSLLAIGPILGIWQLVRSSTLARKLF